MILIDANVVVALVDEREELHARAWQDFVALRREALRLAVPVLAECYFILRSAYLRDRLQRVLRSVAVEPVRVEETWSFWDEVLEWLERYQDHQPDFADAYLAVLAGQDGRYRIWSYDREFHTIWRRPDGSPVPLAVSLY